MTGANGHLRVLGMQIWSTGNDCGATDRVASLHRKVTSQASKMTHDAQQQCVACMPFAVKHKRKHSTYTKLQQRDIGAHLLGHREVLNLLQSLLQATVHSADQIIMCHAPLRLCSSCLKHLISLQEALSLCSGGQSINTKQSCYA